MKNKKQLAIILGIFFAIMIAYFFTWRMFIKKSEELVSDFLKDMEYSSINVSGFPFMKNVTINDLVFKQESKLLTQNKVKIGEVKLKSVMFGSKYSIRLNDIKYIVKDSENNFVFNKSPEIELSFYSNGSIKNVYYLDEGYRIVDDKQKTIYKSDLMKIDLKSIVNDSKIDYAIYFEIQNLQNFNIFETKNEVKALDAVPDEYSIKIDLSTSLEKTENNNNLSLICRDCEITNATKKISFILNTDLKSTKVEPLVFGNVKLKITNYSEAVKMLDAILRKAAKDNSKTVFKTQKDYNDFNQNLSQVFDLLSKVSDKNEESTTTDKVFLIERESGSYDYRINGQSLYQILLEQQ